MSSRRNRVDRLERRFPQSSGVQHVLDAELRALSDDEVRTRLARRFADMDASPEGKRRAAELAAMTDQQLLDEWERMPRYRDGRGSKGGR